MSRILSVRNKHASGLAAALEGLADTAPATEEVTVVAEPDSGEAMQAQADLDQAANDVEEAHEALGELEEGAEALEAIAVALESTLADGGLTPQAAVFMRQSVDNVTHRFGFQHSITPALESFGGETTRLQATNIALESISDTLKKVWEAIKRVCAKVWEAIVAFFDRLFNVAPRVKHKAEALLKQLSELKGEPKGEIEVGDLAAKVSINGKFVSIIKLNKLLDSAVEVSKVNVDAIAKYSTCVAESAGKHSDSVADKTIVNKLIEISKNAAKAVGDFNKEEKNTPEEREFSSEMLPGNNKFVVRYSFPKEGDSLVQALGRLAELKLSRVHVGGMQHEGKLPIRPGSLDEMKRDLEKIIEVADKCIDAKKNISVVIDDAKKNLRKVEEDTSKETDEHNASIVQAQAHASGKLLVNASRIPYEVYKYGAETMTAYLTVIARSMKAYGEDKKKDESKPAEEPKKEKEAKA